MDEIKKCCLKRLIVLVYIYAFSLNAVFKLINFSMNPRIKQNLNMAVKTGETNRKNWKNLSNMAEMFFQLDHYQTVSQQCHGNTLFFLWQRTYRVT